MRGGAGVGQSRSFTDVERKKKTSRKLHLGFHWAESEGPKEEERLKVVAGKKGKRFLYTAALHRS